MRILFAFAGGSGHVDPLLPIAGAAEAAGHTVAITGKAAVVPTVEALGFSVFPSRAGASEPATERLPLLELSAECEDAVRGTASPVALGTAGPPTSSR